MDGWWDGLARDVFRTQCTEAIKLRARVSPNIDKSFIIMSFFTASAPAAAPPPPHTHHRWSQ